MILLARDLRCIMHARQSAAIDFTYHSTRNGQHEKRSTWMEADHRGSKLTQSNPIWLHKDCSLQNSGKKSLATDYHSTSNGNVIRKFIFCATLAQHKRADRILFAKCRHSVSCRSIQGRRSVNGRAFILRSSHCSNFDWHKWTRQCHADQTIKSRYTPDHSPQRTCRLTNFVSTRFSSPSPASMMWFDCSRGWREEKSHPFCIIWPWKMSQYKQRD